MNKLIIFHQEFDKPAGTERVLYNIAEYFSLKTDNQVALLLSSLSDKLIFDIDKLPIEIRGLDMDRISGGKFSLLCYYWRLFFKLKTFVSTLNNTDKYTIICSNATLSALFYFNVRFKKNIEIIACEHFSYHVSGRFSRIMRRLFYGKVNVVALTEKDRDKLQMEFDPKICKSIPNAIPFALKQYDGIDKNVILSIGRFTYQKGYDLLLESLSRVDRNIFQKWKVIIVGDDYGDKALMERIMQKNSLNFVELHSSSSYIQEYYAKSTFYVMSSRFEGLPMVLLESLGFGLPIVSFDCPTGPAELVNNENGILVPNGDIDALADAIRFMIENPKAIESKAKGAEETALRYSKERINEMWGNLLSEIWQNKKSF